MDLAVSRKASAQGIRRRACVHPTAPTATEVEAVSAPGVPKATMSVLVAWESAPISALQVLSAVGATSALTLAGVASAAPIREPRIACLPAPDPSGRRRF